MRGLTSITRRRAVKLAAASAAAGAFGFAGRAEENILYVNSWGGSMEEAEVPAYFQPFTSKTGIRIRPVSPVSFAKLKAQVQSRHFEWDVSSTGKTDVQAAVHEGLLEPIDFSIVDRSKLAPDMIYGDHSIANMSLAIGLFIARTASQMAGRRVGRTSGTSSSFLERVLFIRAPIPICRSPCSPMGCLLISSIRSILTEPSGRWTRSSRTSKYGGSRARSRNSSSATARWT